MKISEVMTRNPATSDIFATLPQVATLMFSNDCAAIPVVQSDTVVGIITDRDIACRAVARNTPDVRACDVMTTPAIAVASDDPIEKAVELMKDNRIHHLLVIDAHGTLLGIVAQSDLGRRMSNRELGDLARGTSIRTNVWPASLPVRGCE